VPDAGGIVNIVARWKVYGAAILLLVVGYNAWAHHQRAIGARDAMLRESARQYADLYRQKQKIDSVYVVTRDTLRFTRTRTDTVLNSITDTLINVDTVRVIVERERQACDLVIRSCEQRVAVRDSIIDVIRLQNRLLLKSTRGPGLKTGIVLGVLGSAAVAIGASQFK
jgi:hypothetical protein